MQIMDSDIFYKKYIEKDFEEYYVPHGEFDIVTEDESGYVFYEVKFRKKPVSDDMIDEEIEQVKATGIDCYKYVFFSRSGFRCEKRDDVVLIALEEIFA